MREFKIHCSAIHHIMGSIGLTEAQQRKFNELIIRQTDSEIGTAKPLTENMKSELAELRSYFDMLTNPLTAYKLLPTGCQTFLKEWYAADHEEIDSKYIWKGNEVELENIDFAARMLGYGMADKNKEQRSDEYFVGECDVDMLDAIVDVKSAWNNKTLLDNLYGIDPQHEYQGRGYMRLWNRDKFIVFHGLLNTPETDYRPEISFDHIPESQRWIAYMVTRDLAIEDQIIERVKLCRIWLAEYDKLVQSKVGRVWS